MNITWHGLSCFRIQDAGRDREVTVITDPFSPEDKVKPPRSLSGDILLISHDHPRHNNVGAVSGTPFLIAGPGEFEVKEVTVNGISTHRDSSEEKEHDTNTTFYINIGGVHILFLGDLNHDLDEVQFRDMHEIDVLLIPVGGNGVLTPKQAADICGQLEPRIIIPMHFRTGGIAQEHEPIESFLKAMGSGSVEPIAKLKITDKELPQDEMQIVVLDPQ